ncbi:MAG: energy transducer TonB [Candidatus Thiodiazotropha sp. (ex Lucinoma aequizonata)]|nr:energy transducer TonB [Candidatus Thiodiazotropha sp. (ex Lucinoma aequizonata)]MCU7894092.1 energy transducer TonB [Candidatus Thiodiazotropha sp. (ex Lucinoma aequizonata)]MCU7900525.1 energy transducer TonB [Candidatus Thiodiazotropha sp. (ex Lucinoma aequizonata)]MCU7901453.1 energy transducer TonB [Candidatus Thiodiazotropha sp. (ex Lucinoma aequizonata)]MCU7907322.1 energy transducer TonB [Candidatus Thiodiazotropha sp. (ex Lucinoma aequizonata)]
MTALLIALVVNLALFWLLEQMLKEKETQVERVRHTELVEFVRLKREREPLSKEEPEPADEKHEPPPLTPKPMLKRANLPRPELPEWQIPEFDIPLDIGTGPYIGSRPMLPEAEIAEAILRLRFPPSYPQRALMRYIEGKVVLRFTINPDGTVSQAEVVDADPPGYFEQSALRAIRRWKFHPKVENGVAIARTATQTIKFSLKK